MKTKIGEKTSKKTTGIKETLKTYPGIGLILAAIVIGGVGFGAMTLADTSGDQQVLETENPAVEQEEVKEEVKEEQPEEVAKTTDEAVSEIVAAGAESAEFTSADEGMTLDVVMNVEATEEEITAVNDAVVELLSNNAFVKANLFEGVEEKAAKAYAVNYILGEGDAAYTTTASYYASNGRNGWLYTCSGAWNGPEAVKAEEEDVPVASTTPADAASGTAANNNTTTGTGTATGTQTTPSTQTQLKPLESEAEIAASATSLHGKAKKYSTSINSDIIGWLQIPGTSVDYPVTHTTNNTYYMNYNIYKQWSKDGALVADYECNFNSGLPTNTVIYGHNWNNCWAPFNNRQSYSMFEEVHDYADASFAASHPYIYFSTTEKDYKYQVFAAFYTHQNWTDYIYAYPDATRFNNVITTAKNNSLHNFSVKVSSGDKIISLSTCTRAIDSTGNYRFVVMAKLVG